MSRTGAIVTRTVPPGWALLSGVTTEQWICAGEGLGVADRSISPPIAAANRMPGFVGECGMPGNAILRAERVGRSDLFRFAKRKQFPLLSECAHSNSQRGDCALLLHSKWKKLGLRLFTT
jgi:hypothetical protein